MLQFRILFNALFGILFSVSLWLLSINCLGETKSYNDGGADEKAADKPIFLPENMERLADIEYRKVNDLHLKLDLYRLKNKEYKNAPLVVYIHGGGFTTGDKRRVSHDDIFPVVKAMTSKGAICASLDYRLLSVDNSSPVTVFDAAVDCKDALRFLVKEASTYGIDVNHMAVFGGSAGGELSLLTVLGDDSAFPGSPELSEYVPHFNCVMAFYGVDSSAATGLDRQKMTPDEIAKKEKMIGGSLEEKRDILEKISVATWLKKTSPPIFFAHGESDATVPVRNSINMHALAQEKGIPTELIVSKGAGHVFKGKNISPTVEEIDEKAVEFLSKYLLVQ
jgi:acetyl esterase/lipase